MAPPEERWALGGRIVQSDDSTRRHRGQEVVPRRARYLAFLHDRSSRRSIPRIQRLSSPHSTRRHVGRPPRTIRGRLGSPRRPPTSRWKPPTRSCPFLAQQCRLGRSGQAPGRAGQSRATVGAAHGGAVEFVFMSDPSTLLRRRLTSAAEGGVAEAQRRQCPRYAKRDREPT